MFRTFVRARCTTIARLGPLDGDPVTSSDLTEGSEATILTMGAAHILTSALPPKPAEIITRATKGAVHSISSVGNVTPWSCIWCLGTCPRSR